MRSYMLASSQLCLNMALCLCICEICHVFAVCFDIASFFPPLQCPFPSRRSQHTDDSALLVVRALHKMEFEIAVSRDWTIAIVFFIQK